MVQVVRKLMSHFGISWLLYSESNEISSSDDDINTKYFVDDSDYDTSSDSNEENIEKWHISKSKIRSTLENEQSDDEPIEFSSTNNSTSTASSSSQVAKESPDLTSIESSFESHDINGKINSDSHVSPTNTKSVSDSGRDSKVRQSKNIYKGNPSSHEYSNKDDEAHLTKPRHKKRNHKYNLDQANLILEGELMERRRTNIIKSLSSLKSSNDASSDDFTA